MPSALDQFMSGMISKKSKEIGATVDCVLVVDNALPDSESFNECASSSHCSVVSTSDSVATVDTATMTTCVSEELHNNLDISEDHIRMLRWSASMGGRKALAELEAVEEYQAKRDSIEYEKKLRWCAAMGDTVSIRKLNAASNNSRWSAGCAEQERKPVPSKRSLVQPKRRPSFRLSKKVVPDEVESSKNNLVQPKRRPSFRLPKLSLR
ncbi:MAG: hypothetical protein SGBAC_012371 [Bacillariaceae sp.]